MSYLSFSAPRFFFFLFFLFFLFLGQLNARTLSASNEVCCELTGCFNNSPPFDRLPLPMCTDPPKNTPTFNLFTPSNPHSPHPITPDYLSSNFSDSNPTYFIGHGWNSNGLKGWVIRMKDAMLERDDVNVIAINWEALSNMPDYSKAAANVRTVGAHTGLVMQAIRKRNKKSYLYCVGHSLASHVCAHAGLRVKIDRISGIDPAGPGFESHPDVAIGLHVHSAAFVDVIHTDPLLGTSRPLGHVDFYPNGGSKQPGCLTNSCSHSMAHSFFIESIKQDCFVATMNCSNHATIPDSCEECGGCGLMGYGAEDTSSGLRLLRTSKKEPYCLSSR